MIVLQHSKSWFPDEQINHHLQKSVLIYCILNKQQINVAVQPQKGYFPSLSLQFAHLLNEGIRFDRKGGPCPVSLFLILVLWHYIFSLKSLTFICLALHVAHEDILHPPAKPSTRLGAPEVLQNTC